MKGQARIVRKGAALLLTSALALSIALNTVSCGGGEEEDDSKSVAVTGVTLDITSKTIAVGGTVQLTATVQPGDATNKSVSWDTDKPSIATVDASGLVLGVATGSAIITVKTADGSKTATATITVVVPNTAAITKVTINGSESDYPAKVGETLLAVAYSADDKVVTDATFAWGTYDGTTITAIPGATSDTYTVASADLGKCVGVDAKNANTTGTRYAVTAQVTQASNPTADVTFSVTSPEGITPSVDPSAKTVGITYPVGTTSVAIKVETSSAQTVTAAGVTVSAITGGAILAVDLPINPFKVTIAETGKDSIVYTVTLTEEKPIGEQSADTLLASFAAGEARIESDKTTVTLLKSVTLAAIVKVGEGATLSVPQEVELAITTDGSITIEGSLSVAGTVYVGGGTLKGSAEITPTGSGIVVVSALATVYYKAGSTDVFVGEDGSIVLTDPALFTLSATEEGALVTTLSGGEAEVPADKTLHISNADVIDDGSSLSVKGTLALTSGGSLSGEGTITTSDSGIITKDGANYTAEDAVADDIDGAIEALAEDVAEFVNVTTAIELASTDSKVAATAALTGSTTFTPGTTPATYEGGSTNAFGGTNPTDLTASLNTDNNKVEIGWPTTAAVSPTKVDGSTGTFTLNAGTLTNSGVSVSTPSITVPVTNAAND